MDERINYWLDIAEYDLATAEALLKAERNGIFINPVLPKRSRKMGSLLTCSEK